jgi:phage terminase Nu1 subunit (DNA packaging protein)
MANLVTVATVAKALNLTDRRIAQLVKEGMPRAERGRYDPWACALWYVRYLQKALTARGTENDEGGATSWREERKRLARFQANNEELLYKKNIGELIPAELLRSKFAQFASTTHDRFLSLPSRMAPKLEGESREVIRVKLYEAVRDVLNGLVENPMGSESASKRGTETDRTKRGRADKSGGAAIRRSSGPVNR